MLVRQPKPISANIALTAKAVEIRLRCVASALASLWPSGALVLGTLGIVGVPGSWLASCFGLLDTASYLFVALIAILTFTLSTLVGALGCPKELLRRREQHLVRTRSSESFGIH